MEILFTNATIIDGSGNKPFTGDLLISGDRIEAIIPKDTLSDGDSGCACQCQSDMVVEQDLPDRPSSTDDNHLKVTDDESTQIIRSGSDDSGLQIIDVTGKVIAPGFIDCHSHNDWFCLRDDETTPFFDTFISQGITSMVTGNCGFSATCFPEDSPFLDDLGGELFSIAPDKRHGHCDDWLAAIDRQMPVNISTLLGHGTARLAVAGLTQQDLSPEQEQQMLDLLEEGLKRGAAGISLGLMYAPGIFAPTSELEKVARLCAKYDKILTVHPRAESAISLSYGLLGRSHLLRALDELEQLTRKTNCRFHYSHLIFVGRKSWKDVDEALAILEKMKADGFDVGFDMYPLHFGASVITVILPEWYQRMNRADRQKRSTKLKLKMMIGITIKLLGFGFDDIMLAYAGEKHPTYNGRTISEIAKAEGRKPLDVYLQVCEDSDFKARVLMGSYQNDDIVDRLMRHPLSLYMTDAWFEEQGIQNSGIYGAFPRFLKLGREKNIPLEQTISKMTGKTAERFQLPDRGFIREGYYADLVLFDPKRISNSPDPEGSPLGIEQVYINGQIALDNSRGGLQLDRINAGRSIWVGEKL